EALHGFLLMEKEKQAQGDGAPGSPSLAPRGLPAHESARRGGKYPRAMTPRDNAFPIGAASVRFGPGVPREVGRDLRDLGSRRTLVLIDQTLRDVPPGQMEVAALRKAGMNSDRFDGIEVEPTDRSFAAAICVASEGRFDSSLAVGGRSTIGTM